MRKQQAKPKGCAGGPKSDAGVCMASAAGQCKPGPAAHRLTGAERKIPKGREKKLGSFADDDRKQQQRRRGGGGRILRN